MLLFYFLDAEELLHLLLEDCGLALLGGGGGGGRGGGGLNHSFLHFVQLFALGFVGGPVLAVILFNGIEISLGIALAVDFDALLRRLPLLGVDILTIHIIEYSLYIKPQLLTPKIPQHILLLNLLIHIIPNLM